MKPELGRWLAWVTRRVREPQPSSLEQDCSNLYNAYRDALLQHGAIKHSDVEAGDRAYYAQSITNPARPDNHMALHINTVGYFPCVHDPSKTPQTIPDDTPLEVAYGGLRAVQLTGRIEGTGHKDSKGNITPLSAEDFKRYQQIAAVAQRPLGPLTLHLEPVPDLPNDFFQNR